MRITLLLSLLVISITTFAQNENIVRKKNGKYIYAADGNWWWHTRYDSIREFSCKRAAVLKNGKWRFIDTAGNQTLKPKYNAVRPG